MWAGFLYEIEQTLKSSVYNPADDIMNQYGVTIWDRPYKCSKADVTAVVAALAKIGSAGL